MQKKCKRVVNAGSRAGGGFSRGWFGFNEKN
jgi:hypothetical protein